MLSAMATYSRRRLLTTGAVGGMALVAAPAAALGATPAPVDDDLAYLQIASVAKLVSIALLDRALKQPDLLERATRRLDAFLTVDAPSLRRLAPTLRRNLS
jgi:hypothetical protein